jgi:hypothetical protein
VNTPATTASSMSAAVNACPYCGEQVLAVAVKCEHCGSSITDSTSVATVVTNQFKSRPTFAVLLGVVVAVIGAGWVYNLNRTGTLSGRGFSAADVASIEQSIRMELSKQRGAAVEEVQLVKESPRKLTGFAKVKVPLLGTVNRTCTATMGENGQAIWECR